jgi:glycosyltransferase involved in cell wall biosynthesis
VDLTHFSPDRFGSDDRAALRRRLGVRPGEHVVGFVGRLVREKGVLELLSAVGARPGLKLWLIGPDERGSKRDALEPGALTAVANVRWLGLQRDMPPLYAAMDVLALPSYREGFPRTLLEASAMERPVVASAIRGCREAVSPRETGLLVPPARPGDLRSALDALRGDAARRRALGRAARIRARKLFDETAVFDRIALAYRELALPSGATSGLAG